MFPKVSTYIKSNHGQTKWMNSLFEYDGLLLGKFNTIWDKVSADIKI